MKVIILCGGQGTRLREETEFRPKPLVEIGGRPILWHIMKLYAHHGFREFVLCLGYRGSMIKDYFLNYEAMNNDCTVCLGQQYHVGFNGHHEEQDFHVTLADTGHSTLTGGRLKRVQKYIGDEPFMLTYGDGVSDVNLRQLLAFHQSHGRTGTITAVQPLVRFGKLEMESDGRVTDFTEKPRADYFVSGGFFVFEPKIFEYLSGDDCALEESPLERLAAEGQLYAYRHPGFFYAMDTYREYQFLNELWNRNEAPWRIWT